MKGTLHSKHGRRRLGPVSTTTTSTGVDQVDEVPPLRTLIPLGLQHVLAMYAGAVAVPFVVGGALIAAGKLTSADLSLLINADLFIAGIASIIQSVGFWRFGVRLPMMQGCTFAAVGPMIAIGTGPNGSAAAIYGAVIACGAFMLIAAPFFSMLVRFFPPLVTGTVILLIGLSLLDVAGGWIADNSTKGAPVLFVAFAFGTLVLIVLIERFAPTVLARLSILLGLVIGTIVAIPFGLTEWGTLGDEPWFGVSLPFQFGAPVFQPAAIVTMIIVGLVIMTETTGDMIAIGEIVGKPITRQRLADGLRADGLSTILGGVFNTFPYTAFAQNVGLVGLTGVRSRYVATFAGGVLVVLGLVPKLGGVVAGLPIAVLGGAGVALFGTVAASGIRTLTKVRFNNSNILVVALAIGVGMLPTVYPTIYDRFPSWFQTIFDSGISAGAITAVVLNLLLNSRRRQAQFDSGDDLAAYDASRGAQTSASSPLPGSTGAVSEPLEADHP